MIYIPWLVEFSGRPATVESKELIQPHLDFKMIWNRVYTGACVMKKITILIQEYLHISRRVESRQNMMMITTVDLAAKQFLDHVRTQVEEMREMILTNISVRKEIAEKAVEDMEVTMMTCEVTAGTQVGELL